MTFLLFLDESGHDHKKLPLEIRGGVALEAGKLWGFVQGWQALSLAAFGPAFATHGKEVKGMKLLDRDRLRWARQMDPMGDDERRKLASAFLHKGRDKGKPSRSEFSAYGQACLEMARGIFDLLTNFDAKLFAAAIPRGIKPEKGHTNLEYLRKDHVFLFERFYYFLENKSAHGLIVMDESEKQIDRDFLQRMERYFSRTSVGRNRTHHIVPVPFFVSSDLSFPVQAADLCLYCINWGFRPPAWGISLESVRQEIAAEFGPKLAHLQWQGQGSRDGKTYRSWGITLVPDPYQGRANEKGGNAPTDTSEEIPSGPSLQG